MIPIQEIRVGNKVDLYGTIATIQRSDFDINGVGIAIDEGKPIPLTEEWLIKFGFEKSNDMDHFYHVKILNEWTRIYYNSKHKVCELSINRHGAVIKIKYVHQLQNLYFALTGKELIIQ